MKHNFIVFCLLIFPFFHPFKLSAQNNSTLDDMLVSIGETIENKDVKGLSKLILVDDVFTEEYVELLADIMVSLDTKENRDFIENEHLYKVNKHPLDKFLYTTYKLSDVLKNLKSCSASCYAKEEDVLRIKEKGYFADDDFKFKAFKTEKGWKFWPENLRKSDLYKRLKDYHIFKEYKEALVSLSKEKHQEAIDEIILKYVAPTNLKYDKKKINGNFLNTHWEMISGVAVKEKQRIKITLCSGNIKKPECDSYHGFHCGNSITFYIEKEGEFDFGLTTKFIRAFFKNESRGIQTSADGLEGKLKVKLLGDKLKGAVVLKLGNLDKNGYVNGTFEIPYCEDK